MKIFKTKIIFSAIVLIAIGFVYNLASVKKLLFFKDNISSNILSNVDLDNISAKCGRESDKIASLQCWDNIVDEVLKSYGIGPAVDLAAKFYEVAGSPYECHDLMHKIGFSAYDMFESGKNFELPNNLFTCSFGFFHAFMQALTNKTGDPNKAREFCDFLDNQKQSLGGKSGRVRFSCFHGIGHGWASKHDNVQRSPDEFVEPAFKLCESVVSNQIERTACATGVFDSLSLEVYNGRMEIDKKDPLAFCRKQSEQYKEACYLDLMPAVSWLGGYDLSKSAVYSEEEKDDHYANVAIKSLADHSMAFVIKNPDGFSNSVKKCRNIQKRLQTSCLKGLLDGIVQFSPPGSKLEDWLKYCEDKILTDNEAEICRSTLISYN